MVETHLCKLRGTSDTFVRGLAAVGKLTKIVEVENEIGSVCRSYTTYVGQN